MKGKLTVLMITAFVDMLGLAMVIPLLPFYATKLGASATIVGVLIAAFSIAQLASAPLWGRFSDRYGRRPALLAGRLVSAVAYVIFGYASTLWLLLISRVVQGPVSYTHLRAHETRHDLVCRLLLEKKKQ